MKQRTFAFETSCSVIPHQAVINDALLVRNNEKPTLKSRLLSSPHLTPPIPTFASEDLGDFHAWHAFGEAAAAARFAVGARRWRGDGGLVAVDVFTVDVLRAGNPGGALFAARVPLFQPVNFQFGFEGVDEAHCGGVLRCMCVVLMVFSRERKSFAGSVLAFGVFLFQDTFFWRTGVPGVVRWMIELAA